MNKQDIGDMNGGAFRTCLSLKFIAKKFIDVLCLIELITKDTN